MPTSSMTRSPRHVMSLNSRNRVSCSHVGEHNRNHMVYQNIGT